MTEAGDGEPIIVLHGGPGGSLGSTVRLVDGLDDEFRLVLYDQRGSILSPADPDTLSFETCLEDLGRLVDEIGAPLVHLVGYSFGALLAGAYVGRAPERVGRVVLVNPGHMRRSLDGRDRDLEKHQLHARARIESDPAWETVIQSFDLPVDPSLLAPRARSTWNQIRDAWLFTTHPDRYRQVHSLFFNRDAGLAIWASMPDTWDHVAPLLAHRHRVTVIVGDRDLVDPGAKLAQRWCAPDGNLTCHVVSRAGHACWVDEPQVVRAHLLAALCGD